MLNLTNSKKFFSLFTLGCFYSTTLFSASYTVNTSADSGAGSLRQAILSSNAAGGSNYITINISGAGSIVLQSPLPPITASVSILTPGYSQTIDGSYMGGNSPGFVLASSSGSIEVSLSNLILQNMQAQGGLGGGSTEGFCGGGGAGLGGAVLVGDNASATLTNVSCIDNAAIGGNGGTSIYVASVGAGGGGGGLHGQGGNAYNSSDTTGVGGGGGGGLIGSGGEAGANGGGGGGGAGDSSGNNANGGDGNGAGGTAGSGGGGEGGALNAGGDNATFFGGGGGGGGGESVSGEPGGNGGYGGGGGGGGGQTNGMTNLSNGGSGGFGGGGGGASGWGGSGGDGGFGGGGGGGIPAGTSVFGGGTGSTAVFGNVGGGGAGLGGAFFVQNGSSLTLNYPFSVTGSNVTGGTGNESGQALGRDIFLQSGGTLTFNVSSSNTLTIPNPIASDQGAGGGSGGGVVIMGSGTTELNGINTYTGGTTVNSGATLLLNTGSLLGDVANMGTFTINKSLLGDVSTLSNTITGSGGIINKTGDLTLILDGSVDQATINVNGGTLTLSGASTTATSAINVNEGILDVEGSVTTPLLTVASEGALVGVGPITGDVNVSGIIAPGVNGVGNLSITGNVSQNNGSILALDLTPSGSDVLAVTGSYTIDSGATLDSFFSEGNYNPFNTFTVVTATEGVNGTFSSVSNSSSNLIARAMYFPNSIELTVTEALLNAHGNALRVAGALNTLTPTVNGDLLEVIYDILVNEFNNQQATLDQLHPALYKNLLIAQQQNAVNMRSAVSYRLDNLIKLRCTCPLVAKRSQSNPFLYSHEYENKEEEELFAEFEVSQEKSRRPIYSQENCLDCEEERQHTVWMHTFGDLSHQKKIQGVVGYLARTWGGGLGYDYKVSDDIFVGGIAGYTYSDVDWKYRKGSGTIQSCYGGFYSLFFAPNVYLGLEIMGAWDQFQASRHIQFIGVDRTASTTHQGSQFLGHLELGYNINYPSGATLRPFESFDYVFQHEDGFTEKGAGSLNLKVRSNNTVLARNELGLNYSKCWGLTHSKWALDFKLSWVGEYRGRGKYYRCEFVGTDVPFKAKGIRPQRNMASPGVKITGFFLDDALSVSLGYDGEFMSRYYDQTIGLFIQGSF